MRRINVLVCNDDNNQNLEFEAEILDGQKFKVKKCEFDYDPNCEYEIESVFNWIKQMI